MRRLSFRRVMAYATLVLGLLMVALVFVSWLLSAVMRESDVRSLLSSEGLRWFLSTFVDHMATPCLVWLVLGSIAAGTVARSGILSYRPSEYRQRVAMWLVAIELLLFTAIMFVLTMIPHAILLSVTGHLFPSGFTQSVVPYTCYAVCVMSLTFAWMSGRPCGVVDVFDMLTYGFRWTGALFVVYVFLVQFVASFVYVFGQTSVLALP